MYLTYKIEIDAFDWPSFSFNIFTFSMGDSSSNYFHCGPLKVSWETFLPTSLLKHSFLVLLSHALVGHLLHKHHLWDAGSVTLRCLLFFLPSPCWSSLIIVSNVTSFLSNLATQKISRLFTGDTWPSDDANICSGWNSPHNSPNGVLGQSVSPSSHVTLEFCGGQG